MFLFSRDMTRQIYIGLPVLFLIANLLSPVAVSAGDVKAKPGTLVKKVALAGNVIFDDRSLAKVVNMGNGMRVTPGLLDMLLEEVRAYYFTNGYFLVKTDILKQRDGILDVLVDEREQLKSGVGEKARAERVIERLVAANKKLKADRLKKEDAIIKLAAAYQTQRVARAEQEAREFARQQERVREWLAGKTAKDEARKLGDSEKLAKMRERVKSIFNVPKNASGDALNRQS